MAALEKGSFSFLRLIVRFVSDAVSTSYMRLSMFQHEARIDGALHAQSHGRTHFSCVLSRKRSTAPRSIHQNQKVPYDEWALFTCTIITPNRYGGGLVRLLVRCFVF